MPTAVLSTLLTAIMGWWIGAHPEVQSAIAAPDDLRRLTSPVGSTRRITPATRRPRSQPRSDEHAQAVAICWSWARSCASR